VLLHKEISPRESTNVSPALVTEKGSYRIMDSHYHRRVLVDGNLTPIEVSSIVLPLPPGM
jgi:hypothetical protein